MPDNPMYNLSPALPPGLSAVPYIAGPIVADMTGGIAGPYVPPNMSVYDASYVTMVNNPLYKTMMSRMYSQFGTQIGNTLGSMWVVQSLGTMGGYTPEETKRALSGGVNMFARSKLGAFVMPFVDSGLNAMGLTGGSFVAMGQEAYRGRMGLMGPGVLLNPYDTGQQHQAMAAAAATATMLNGIMSKRNQEQKLLTTVEQRLMQGFSRERVTQMVMNAAGRGMFTTNIAQGFEDIPGTGVGGLADRLAQAVGGSDIDLSRLSDDNFRGKAGGVLNDEKAAQRLERLKKEFHRSVQGLTEAMGAMRDLTGYVDEELEKLLDEATNGAWNRSGSNAFAARDIVRTFHAVTQAYNLNPNRALDHVRTNRMILQQAAGFDESMQAFGFNGGGMFGLAAQTELMAGIEDMINARGVRGDPILAGRMRLQGSQLMARNINSSAGRAAQILAYARQTGILPGDMADGLTEMLTSGDRGIMGEGINRLLTLVFGSSEAGRRFMNDSMQMNAMRMSMDDNAGKLAMAVTMTGASAEYHRREQVSAAGQRLRLTQQALAESGMNTWQTPGGIGKVVDYVVQTIQGDPSKLSAEDRKTRLADAEAFKKQYDALVAKGWDPRMAAHSIIEAYRKSPATARYAQDIDLAVKEQAAVNNEEILEKGGALEGRQAAALLQDMLPRGLIDGRTGAEIYEAIRAGRGVEALARVDSIVGNLDPATRQLLGRVRSDAAEKHIAALDAMRDNVAAVKRIQEASVNGFSAEDVAKAYETMASAGKRYLESGQKPEDYSIFWDSISKANVVQMLSDKALEDYIGYVKGGRVDELSKMARQAAAMRRVAVTTLQDSGFGSWASGFWGGGHSSVNSKKAKEERDATVAEMTRRANEAAFKQAGDRDSFVPRAVEFLMGRADWEKLLNIYDPEKKRTELRESLKEYGIGFRAFLDAQERFNDLQEPYKEALGVLAAEGREDAIPVIKKKMAEKGLTSTRRVEEWLGGLVDGDDPRAQRINKAIATVKATVSAKNALVWSKANAHKALGSTMDNLTPQQKMEYQNFFSWKDFRDERDKKLQTDKKLAEFLDDFDFSEEGMRNAKGASAEFIRKLNSTVTTDEVSAKIGRPISSKEKSQYGEAMLAVARDKMIKFRDEGATDVFRAARAASREHRISGTLTIKDGWSQRDAVVDAYES